MSKFQLVGFFTRVSDYERDPEVIHGAILRDRNKFYTVERFEVPGYGTDYTVSVIDGKRTVPQAGMEPFLRELDKHALNDPCPYRR